MENLKKGKGEEKKENKLSYYISKQNFFQPAKCDRIIPLIYENNTAY